MADSPLVLRSPRRDDGVMTGLEILRAIISGAMPQAPISGTLHFVIVKADEGAVLFEGKTADDLLNPMGQVHGGWAATLLDSAMGAAVMSTCDAQSTYTTSQISIHLTRAILPSTGAVTADGRVIHRGRRVATAEAHLRDASGALLAHGTSTCLILPR
jgi:uncharacterized protein (TIGR00369 family)